jgi:hypothetical protein
MIVMFRAYRDMNALVVAEDGTSLAVPISLLAAAGLGPLRTGQRLVITHDADGSIASIRLP